MTLTAHSLVGATVVSLIPNPLVSLPLCLTLHFVTDKLPHWDTMTDKNKSKSLVMTESLADMCLGYLLVAVIFLFYLHSSTPIWLLVAGAFFSQLPDLLEFPYLILNWKLPIFYEDYKFQHWIHDLWFDARLKAPWGVVTQTVLVALFLGLLLLLHPFNVLAGLSVH